MICMIWERTCITREIFNRPALEKYKGKEMQPSAGYDEGDD